MKNRFRVSILLLLLTHLCVQVVAQDVLMHTQSIMKQEFMNPAYNSFKDYTSVNLMSRHQWYNKVPGAPNTYAANVYVPISLSGLGVGFTAISESIGLREKVYFAGSISHNIRVSTRNYLAFGYSLGIQSISYDMDRMHTYPDINISGLDLNYTSMNLGVGLFYYTPIYFVGISSNTLMNDNQYQGNTFLPGFDFTAGFMYRISDQLLLRPDFILKYYPINEKTYSNGDVFSSKTDPILDVSINFLLDEKLWLGTSHRFGQAQTFSADVIIKESYKIGYTFELGIGEGMNQFNSHGIRLTWNIISRYALQRFDRNGRVNTRGKLNTYLYK